MFNPERLFRKLTKAGYEIVKLSPYQYRVEAVLDLYPVHCRWHNLADNQRGSWKDIQGATELACFIDGQVAIADRILDEHLEREKAAEAAPCPLPSEVPEISSNLQKRYMTWEPAYVKLGKSG